jgi:hypothetical protein
LLWEVREERKTREFRDPPPSNRRDSLKQFLELLRENMTNVSSAVSKRDKRKNPTTIAMDRSRPRLRFPTKGRSKVFSILQKTGL